MPLTLNDNSTALRRIRTRHRQHGVRSQTARVRLSRLSLRISNCGRSLEGASARRDGLLAKGFNLRLLARVLELDDEPTEFTVVLLEVRLHDHVEDKAGHPQ